MKIAIDMRTAAGEKTGKGWYTFHLVHALLAEDRDNEYILYTNKKIPGFEHFPHATQEIIAAPGLLWHIYAAYRAAHDKVDLFFAPSSYITPCLLPRRIKVLITVHDIVAFLFPNRHNKKAVILEKIFLKWALHRADEVLTVSENTKKDLLKHFTVNPKKLHTVLCGVAPEFAPIPHEKLHSFIKKTNLPEIFFLAVGTLEPRKNYPMLIRAFAELHKTHPNCHLLIVGGKGWQYEEIFALVEKEKLTGYIHFLGYLANKSIQKLYSLAQALVFPSLYEGFGIPPLEAMASGCPVIAARAASIPEVVDDAGILIDPTHPKELTHAMHAILTEPHLRTTLKSKGLTHAKKFSWHKSARKLMGIL